MSKPSPRSIADALARVSFLTGRTPATPEAEVAAAFAELGTCSGAGIFVGMYSGASEWERHPAGDEIVMVLEGETTLFVLVDGVEHPNCMRAGELLVVPQNLWHRFETPWAKVLTVTPPPTEHRLERPT